jgi:hypothetical protein
MPSKLGVADQVISLPKGGGAIKGIGEKFQPDLHTGTGNFSVPIAVPPGRNGFQPELALAYSTGNGPFGLGWGLSVPGVTRKTSKGIPVYDDSKDTFILSGAEDLVPLPSLPVTWAWGDNGHGQLGEDTIGQRLTPVQVRASADRDAERPLVSGHGRLDLPGSCSSFPTRSSVPMPAIRSYFIEPICQQSSAPCASAEREVGHPLGCHKPRILPDRVGSEKLLRVLLFGCAYRRIAEEERIRRARCAPSARGGVERPRGAMGTRCGRGRCWRPTMSGRPSASNRPR